MQVLRPTPGTRARFGATLAVCGDALLVGATARDDTDGDPGAALFRHDAGAFRHLADLRPAKTVDDFARALALTPERVAVSAAGHENGDAEVHVWERDGDAVRGPILVDSPERRAAHDDVFAEYGVALALDGADVLVGANLADAGAEQSGAVHVMRCAPRVRERQRLGPGAVAGSSFGDSLARVGDLLAVGAPTTSSVVRHAGAVHVFARGGDGRFVARGLLAAPAPADGDELGAALAGSDTLLCVGAPRAARGVGRVEIFRRVGAADLVHLVTLRPPVPHDVGLFGRALACDGRHVVVGEPGGPGRRGRVHVYTLTGAGLSAPDTWLAPDAADGDWFGSAVALCGDLVVIGAPANTAALDRARVLFRRV